MTHNNNNDGKRVNVYKEDNWNQMNIHAHGRRFVVSEISSTEGEHTFDFTSRQEMIRWAEYRFEGREDIKDILDIFKKA